MTFLIADTFTDSLTRLTADEQKAAKTTAFDLQMNPAYPGHKLHRIEKSKDKGFWSVRVSADVRLIVHQSEGSFLLCYVDHHDAAYAWAERRKLETHPTTGAAQMVEIREVVREVPRYVEVERPAPPPRPLFAKKTDADLLAFGVPADWLADVRKVTTDDELLALAQHLPREAGEALLQLATGGVPEPSVPAVPATSPFDHPDARRRFLAVGNVAELKRALDYPWDKWAVFLHPEQRALVQKHFQGPARVSGSAGTGKTVVALHRAVHLARKHHEARVLLATFSEPLANALRTNVRRLLAGEPELAERIDVAALDELGLRLYRARVGPAELASREQIRDFVAAAAGQMANPRFSTSFLLSEWEQVADPWQTDSAESYAKVSRLGRKARLSDAQRADLWGVFARVRQSLASAGLLTSAAIFTALARDAEQGHRPPFDFVVLDEAQDVSIPQLKFLAAVAGTKPNGLFFAGDIGQRIFQHPFSWKSVGVNVQGRSRYLKVNYRTSHQIRSKIDRLLNPEISDADGNTESRRGLVSVFEGPPATLLAASQAAEEGQKCAVWIQHVLQKDVKPHEVAIFVRSPAQYERAIDVCRAVGLPHSLLDERLSVKPEHLSIGTMHLAKGLEFKAVAVVACDDEVVPLQERVADIGDQADLEQVLDSERHLLYVACSRAREFLWVSGTKPVSDFLTDLFDQTR